MSAAFSFGSLGDIITISKLVYQLARALDDSRGSVKAYRDLRQDLNIFGQILVQVIATYEMYDSSAWLRNIDVITKSVVEECAVSIREALDRFATYESSLRPGPPSNCVKDTFKKIKWLGEKRNVEELRDKLRTGSERITMLLMSARLDCRTMLSRMDEVETLLKDERQLHEMTVAVLEAQLEKNRRQICLQLDSIQAAVDRQEGSTRLLLFYAKSTLGAVKSLQQVVGQVFQVALSLRELVVQSIYVRSLDPTKGLPVTFEDALGNVREIPLDWINSWESLHSLILLGFENQKGYGRVARRQYFLEDHISNRELDLQRPFSLRRGMKINMMRPKDAVCSSCYSAKIWDNLIRILEE
ncbi:hypothetical protein GE09DRAFT_1265508 [Coniochaeta sp. 2T2.1]|nr:hypothetical protein GE09DRAFT_1265508 [Coniochaeta sp. 2T2.1]